MMTTRLHRYIFSPPENTKTIDTPANYPCNNEQQQQFDRYNPLLLGIGGTLFLLPHLAILLSLPPVLLRRGAPYLPTFETKLNSMFDLVRHHVSHSQFMQHKQGRGLRFVDLGSGDGRVVFRASREEMFVSSVGYEINPALHIFASVRRLLIPKYWYSTKFYMTDLWNTKLHAYDVVAVYGLSPIMQRLGEKLKDELQPGSIIVSNVFEIPGWKATSNSNSGIGKGVYLYSVPECYGGVNK
jgi:hypothetical protein